MRLNIKIKEIVDFCELGSFGTPTETEFVMLFSSILKSNNIEIRLSLNEHCFYYYDQKQKFWLEIADDVLSSAFWGAWVAMLQEWQGATSKKDKTHVFKKRERAILEMSLYKIKIYVLSFGSAFEKMPKADEINNYIPLQNGYIDLTDLSFKTLELSLYNRFVLPFKYKENQAKPALFLKFLEQILPDKEHQEFMLNWMAYTLVPGNTRQKALFMLGSGRNGKGVLTRLMQKMLGKQNYTSLTIPQLNSSTFHFPTMKNKLANMCPDSDIKDVLHAGTFKATTGGDAQTVREIRGEPFELLYFGKLWFSINSLPYFSEKGTAIIERVEILTFPTTISEEQRVDGLEDKILADGGDALFSFLIDRAKELSKTSFMFRAPDDIKNYSRKKIEQTDAFYLFLEDFLEGRKDKEIAIEKDVLYSKYREYCTENGFKSSNFPNFRDSFLANTKDRKDYSITYQHRKTGMHFVFKALITIPPTYVVVKPDGEQVLVDKNGNELF